MGNKKFAYVASAILLFFMISGLFVKKLDIVDYFFPKTQLAGGNTRVEEWTAANKTLEKNGIIFLGDSITQYFNIEESFQGIYTINRGISGDTTDGVLKRMDVSVYELEPSKVFLMIGTNDLGKGETPEHVFKNIQNIVWNIQENSPETAIYIQSLYPVRSENSSLFEVFRTGKRTNEDINAINKKLDRFCRQNDLTYIDVNSNLLDERNMLAAPYTYDGLHITEAGYGEVIETIMPYLYQ